MKISSRAAYIITSNPVAGSARAARWAARTGCCLAAMMAMAIWVPGAAAFEDFSGCVGCHSAFGSGPGDTEHDAHAAAAGGACSVCHWGGSSDPPLSTPTADPISGCVGCHGRAEDAGGDGTVSDGLARGLRRHHANSGVSSCADCHADTASAAAAENTMPPLYGGVAADLDPCDGSEELFGSVTVSLDNDGDGLTDGDDPDCAGGTTTTVVSTTTSSTTTSTTIPGPQPIFGKNLLIKNKLPDDEKKNKILVIAKDGNVRAGAIGSAADPRCETDGGSGSGGSLTVSSDTSGEEHTTDLPCGNWKRLGKDPGPGNPPKGYKYTDPKLALGTCKVVIVKHGKLVKALCLGKGPETELDYDLAEGQPQAPVDVVLTTGAGEHCVQFGGKIAKDGTNGKVFKATKADPPGACP